MTRQSDNPRNFKDFRMRNRTSACALYFVMMAGPVMAQTPADAQLVPPPAWAFNDLACAPALMPVKPDTTNEPPLRIVSVQDPAIRGLLGPGDTLVINAGSSAGLEAGQRFFVRRVMPAIQTTAEIPRGTIHTSGWIQIVGVDTMVSTASVIHACEAIMFDDYLEPFVAPMIAARPLSSSTPQFDNMGHIMTGLEGIQMGGAGGLMTIDRGSNAGVIVGQRYIVFRDKRGELLDTTGLSKAFIAMARNAPLVQVGEVLVVAVRPDDATVQIVTARDAVIRGDLIAPLR
jgi:hypothetical protein